jgi:metallophosphoesterase (TIGR00282 family)
MSEGAEGENAFRVLCLGDIVARPGRSLLKVGLTGLKERYQVHLVIANGENSSGGTGIDPSTGKEILEAGVDIITLGDHTWRRREAREYLNTHRDVCIRPANYPEGAPGRGWTIVERGGVRIGIFNLIGRTFMNAPLECPFRKADEILQGPLDGCDLFICDFHAEATSEKIAMGKYLDGRASLVFGTHTHVQTADNEILPGGTGYITDLGMCGSAGGVIGLDADVAIDRFLSGIPSAYKPARGDARLHGIVASFNTDSGAAMSVELVQLKGD